MDRFHGFSTNAIASVENQRIDRGKSGAGIFQVWAKEQP
jgi:hypothetical protein